MTLVELIKALELAGGADRNLDTQIGYILGFTRVRAPAGGPRKFIWFDPKGEQIGSLPHYTQSLEAAYEMAHTIAKPIVGGLIWREGRVRVRINDGPFCESATPAIALCIAAMKAVQRSLVR